MAPSDEFPQALVKCPQLALFDVAGSTDVDSATGIAPANSRYGDRLVPPVYRPNLIDAKLTTERTAASFGFLHRKPS
jgi:hypothetical protein